jgi:twinkle protein
MTNHDSDFVKHLPCEACGSSDGNALFTDGHTYCYVCKTTVASTGEKQARRMAEKNLLTDLVVEDLPARKLTEETCQLFGYSKTVVNGQRVQVANYYNDKRQVVAQKVRTADKKFWVNGKLDEALLFGQQLWQPREHVKMVTITEGEIDAMSVSQVQANKWPVVSIPTGASGAAAAIRKNLNWLEQFETVVLMFDNDEAGQKAVSECVELFTPGKVKVATLPLKDANDMLKAGRGQEIINAIWNAKVQRPDGIIAGTELWEQLVAPPANDSVPYPFVGLNNLLHGCRRGEMVLFAAGTGVGKSEAVGAIAYDFLVKHNETVGYCALEENPKRTALRFMGLNMGRRLHIEREGVSAEDFKGAYDATVGSGRLFLYDHWGSVEGNDLINKIRFLVRGCGCSTVILDHISIAISGLEVDNERKAIDILMTNLRKLGELNCRLLVICHLRKPEGTSHEEGGRVTLDDLRGSGTLKQLPDAVVALERNQQDETTKLWTLWRVLKNRFSGETGEACWTKYEMETGRMTEGLPELEQTFEPVETNNKDF